MHLDAPEFGQPGKSVAEAARRALGYIVLEPICLNLNVGARRSRKSSVPRIWL
jgi:hypothetical protein